MARRTLFSVNPSIETRVSQDGLRRVVFRNVKRYTCGHHYEVVRIANLYARVTSPKARWVAIPSGAHRDPEVGERFLQTGACA
jgi:hypothetical protein